MWSKTALTLFGIVTLIDGQILQRHKFKRQRRQNPHIIPRILNRNSEILSLGFQNNRKTSNRRFDSDSSTFKPSKAVDFELEFTHLDDVEQDAQESQSQAVVLKTDKLSNPLQFKQSKYSGLYQFMFNKTQ